MFYMCEYSMIEFTYEFYNNAYKVACFETLTRNMIK